MNNNCFVHLPGGGIAVFQQECHEIITKVVHLHCQLCIGMLIQCTCMWEYSLFQLLNVCVKYMCVCVVSKSLAHAV